MSDHTPAQLARILAPLWEAVPEARPAYSDNGIHDTLCVKEWDRNIGLHWCFEGRDGCCVFITDGLARDLILARLQLAIEKRVNANGGYLDMYSAGNLGLNITACLFVPDENSMAFSSIHPDPIIARAQLLAEIIGVELGDADA